MPKSPKMRTIDASVPPAEVVYDAMKQTEVKQTEEGNYALAHLAVSPFALDDNRGRSVHR